MRGEPVGHRASERTARRKRPWTADGDWLHPIVGWRRAAGVGASRRWVGLPFQGRRLGSFSSGRI